MASEISRQNVEALVRKQITSEIIQGAINESAVLKYFRRLPNMTSNQVQMPVLDNLPVAYWQTSDTAMKRTSTMAWKNKYINAEELAVIVPISENVVNDASVDLWAEIRPRLFEAMGKKIDDAILMGRDKPQGFRLGLVDSAINAGATVTSTNDLYKDINNAMSFVEESDFDPTAVLGPVALKSAFRVGMLDSTGQPIRGTEIDSIPKFFVKNGGWDKTKAKMLVGDFSQAVYAIRQDITFDVFREGSIYDPVTKELLYALMQQDMLAIRAVMRLGWEVPNPITSLQPDNSVRFPFAVILNNPAPTEYSVTFTVKDNATTPKAVEGATVYFSGTEKKTDSAGKAIFKVLENNTYAYAVTNADKTVKDKTTQFGAVEVNSANATVDVTLPSGK